MVDQAKLSQILQEKTNLNEEQIQQILQGISLQGEEGSNEWLQSFSETLTKALLTNKEPDVGLKVGEIIRLMQL